MENTQSLTRVLMAVLAVHGAVLLIQPLESNSVHMSGDAIDVTFQTVSSIASAPAKRILPSAPKPVSNTGLSTSKTPATPPTATAQAGVDNGTAEGVGTVSGSGVGRARGDLKEMYLGELRAKIDQNKNYPLQARRLGQSGEVVVAFTIGLDGQIVNPRVTRPSPYKKLNESALAAIVSIRTFRPLPHELSTSPLEVTVPIRYSLNSMN